MVVGVGLVHRRHSGFEPRQTSGPLGALRLPIEPFRGFDEGPLALGQLPSHGQLDFLVSAAQIISAGTGGPERLEQRHGNTPVRHGAARVFPRQLLERLPRFHVHHMVEQGHRTVEVVVGGFAAAHREAYVAQVSYSSFSLVDPGVASCSGV
jgi:hypothetical protein